MDRCQQIRLRSDSLKEYAQEGVRHLTALRNGQLDVHDLAETDVELLNTLAVSTTENINHLRKMFETAENSEMWARHLALLRPIKKEMLQNLGLLRSTASQMAVEIMQANSIIDNSQLLPDEITSEDIRKAISKSHAMIGAEKPRWS